MRALILVAIGCSGAPAKTERPADPLVAHFAVDAFVPVEAEVAVDPDPDGDGLIGDCDLCPSDAETFNAILDEDGCPDSSGISHAVMLDPTNRFGHPAVIEFKESSLATNIASWIIVDDIEAMAVIARTGARLGPKIAANRAALVAKELRKRIAALQVSVRVEERVTSAANVYVDDHVREPLADVIVQIMAATDGPIWKWQNDQLVRARPRRKLEAPPMPAHCSK